MNAPAAAAATTTPGAARGLAGWLVAWRRLTERRASTMAFELTYEHCCWHAVSDGKVFLIADLGGRRIATTDVFDATREVLTGALDRAKAVPCGTVQLDELRTWLGPPAWDHEATCVCECGDEHRVTVSPDVERGYLFDQYVDCNLLAQAFTGFSAGEVRVYHSADGPSHPMLRLDGENWIVLVMGLRNRGAPGCVIENLPRWPDGAQRAAGGEAGS